MQTVRFNELIEIIRSLSFEEKREIRDLLERYLIEERREEIYRNYQESLEELKRGEIEFRDKVDELKSLLE